MDVRPERLDGAVVVIEHEGNGSRGFTEGVEIGLSTAHQPIPEPGDGDNVDLLAHASELRVLGSYPSSVVIELGGWAIEINLQTAYPPSCSSPCRGHPFGDRLKSAEFRQPVHAVDENQFPPVARRFAWPGALRFEAKIAIKVPLQQVYPRLVPAERRWRAGP